MIYENARIWTGDPAGLWAEAMRVEAGRIQAIGSRSAVGEGSERVDLGGSFVCPGLIDSHAHILGFGLGLDRVDLSQSRSSEEAVDLVAKDIASKANTGHTGWIRGRGWDQNKWPGRRYPSRKDLDRVSRDFPISLTRVDGHAVWVNTRALELARIQRENPDPAGGKIHRDEAGNPTGILVDTAKGLTDAMIPEVEEETKLTAIRNAATAMAEVGLTGAHDMGMSSRELELYRQSARTGDLGVRIYGALSLDDSNLDAVLEAGPDREWQNGTFRLGMVKFFVDGALGSRGAALLEPYTDDPGNTGLLILSAEDLEQGMFRALRSGFQCAVHAIGDRAARLALDTWGTLQVKSGIRIHRVPGSTASLVGDRPPVIPPVRLEHAQVMHPTDLLRVGELGVAASVQPVHCISDMAWVPDRLGSDRLERAYAWRSLIAGGAVLAAGSDFPVESHDPLRGIFAAVTRGSSGESAFKKGELSLSREEAMVAFTAAPAYLSGDLHRLGTLSPGKLADFSVYDRNLMTCPPQDILNAHAILTVVEGQVRWADPSVTIPAEGERLG